MACPKFLPITAGSLPPLGTQSRYHDIPDSSESDLGIRPTPLSPPLAQKPGPHPTLAAQLVGAGALDPDAPLSPQTLPEQQSSENSQVSQVLVATSLENQKAVFSDEPPCDTLSSDTGYTFSDTFLLSPESGNPHVGRSSEDRHDKVSRNNMSSPAVNLGGDVLGVREKIKLFERGLSNLTEEPGTPTPPPPGLEVAGKRAEGDRAPSIVEHTEDKPITNIDPKGRIEQARDEYATLQNILGLLKSNRAEIHLELQSARGDLAT